VFDAPAACGLVAFVVVVAVVVVGLDCTAPCGLIFIPCQVLRDSIYRKDPTGWAFSKYMVELNYDSR
jgi:hypothetical protein